MVTYLIVSAVLSWSWSLFVRRNTLSKTCLEVWHKFNVSHSVHRTQVFSLWGSANSNFSPLLLTDGGPFRPHVHIVDDNLCFFLCVCSESSRMHSLTDNWWLSADIKRLLMSFYSHKEILTQTECVCVCVCKAVVVRVWVKMSFTGYYHHTHSRCSLKWIMELIFIWMLSGSCYGAAIERQLHCVCMTVCVCVCERERKRENEREGVECTAHSSFRIVFTNSNFCIIWLSDHRMILVVNGKLGKRVYI